jgi:heme-degrading monooxygenase HmoA
MIGRIWHGWTTHANADAFEAYMRNEVWPSFFAKKVPGFLELQCHRLARPGLTEFKILTWFESMDAVRAFAGEDYHKSFVPERARELLRRYDVRSEHFEVREVRKAA